MIHPNNLLLTVDDIDLIIYYYQYKIRCIDNERTDSWNQRVLSGTLIYHPPGLCMDSYYNNFHHGIEALEIIKKRIKGERINWYLSQGFIGYEQHDGMAYCDMLGRLSKHHPFESADWSGQSKWCKNWVKQEIPEIIKKLQEPKSYRDARNKFRNGFRLIK